MAQVNENQFSCWGYASESTCLPELEPSLLSQGNVAPTINGDQWDLFSYSDCCSMAGSGPLPRSFERTTRLPQPLIPVTVQDANTARNSVLADVGANARLTCDGSWVSNVDSVDARIINYTKNDTGPTSLIGSAGPYASHAAGTACVDSDHDGMPDQWEALHGFNPDSNDGTADKDRDGYTNLEEYLNGTNPHS